MEQLLVHAPGPAFSDLAQAAEDRELLIRHTHVYLIGLDVFFRDGFELSGRCGVNEGFEDREGKGRLSIGDEAAKIGLGYTADWVDV